MTWAFVRSVMPKYAAYAAASAPRSPPVTGLGGVAVSLTYPASDSAPPGETYWAVSADQVSGAAPRPWYMPTRKLSAVLAAWLDQFPQSTRYTRGACCTEPPW